MGTILQDLRFGVRMIRKNPGFTAVAVMTLALGIGAVSNIFSFVNALVLRPYAFKDLDRIVDIWETIPRQGEQYLSAAPANFRDWDEGAEALDLLAARRAWNANLTGAGIAERIEGYQVTADFFSLIGIPPQFGRVILAGDFQPGHPSVVVLSHGFWERNLGADAGIVGKNLRLNGENFGVIGIMPPEMDYPPGGEAWVPLVLTAAEQADRAGHDLQVIGRLKAGVSKSQAQANLDAIATRLAREYPQTNAGHGARVVGLVENLTGGTGPQLLRVMVWAAAFVLLLACANVANLQLARATSRQKEIVMRRTLGATRGQIARQLLMESVLVAGLGGLAGQLLAGWGWDLVRRTIPPTVYQHIAGARHIEVDSRVLAFTILVAVLTGIFAGLAPALHLSRRALCDALREGDRGAASSPGSRRLRGLLVMAEVALALVLLVGAGLMVKGFGRLLSAAPGFDRSHVLTLHVALDDAKYGERERARNFYDQLIERIQALPGVESAATVTSLPSGRSWNYTEYAVEGQPRTAPGELPVVISQKISPDFFRALRIPLLRGRFFTAQDGPGAEPVAIVSETMARRIAAGTDPVGKRLKLGPADRGEPWRRVVGVVGTIKQLAIDEQPDPTAYVPSAQSPQTASALVIRTRGNPLAMAASVRAAVNSMDPDQPPYDMRTLEQVFSDSVLGLKFAARLMVGFGVIALVLAAAGIFAVMAYSVAQRTHEIGVRMALGAQRQDVLKLIVGHAVRLAMLGLSVGVPTGLTMSRALGSLLFGVFRLDALVFVGFTLLLVLVAALTAYVPARRATQVEPMAALRYE